MKKEDYKRAQLVVKKVIDSWDPYALLEGGAIGILTMKRRAER